MLNQKSPLRNLELRIAYTGTHFFGWQVQPKWKTVQGELNRRLKHILGDEEFRTMGCSRTDTGVHAHDQHVELKTRNHIPAHGLQKVLNRSLPDTIRVLSVKERDPDFSVRHNARAKHYTYFFHEGPILSPFAKPYAWEFGKPLDQDKMQRAARLFVGTQCFKALQDGRDHRINTETTIYSATITRRGKLVAYDVVGYRFLYHMVRNMAGALHRVGTGYWTHDQLVERLASRERKNLGMTCPAQGLHLFKVYYGDPPYDPPPERARFERCFFAEDWT